MSDELTIRQALAGLDAWTELQDRADQMRDNAVVAALAAGVTKQQIHNRTMIARTTIDRITKRAAARECAQ